MPSPLLEQPPSQPETSAIEAAPVVHREAIWTASQRTVLIALLCAMLIYLVARYAINPTYVSDPQPLQASRAAELADRIDPNTADVDTLGALPTLGEKRAKLIVDYRERIQRMQPKGGPVYQKPEDLLRIRGIGVATVDQMRPFLMFPTTAPTTTPTTNPEDE